MEDMHASSGNVVSVKELVTKQIAGLVRYMLLMTHYRRPIDFSDEVLVAAGKGLATFDRLFERVDRLAPPGDKKPASLESISAEMLQTDAEPFVRAVMELKMKFLGNMDDDFNTAGAIGVLQQMAGEINGRIERTAGVEKGNPPTRSPPSPRPRKRCAGWADCSACSPSRPPARRARRKSSRDWPINSLAAIISAPASALQPGKKRTSPLPTRSAMDWRS